VSKVMVRYKVKPVVNELHEIGSFRLG